MRTAEYLDSDALFPDPLGASYAVLGNSMSLVVDCQLRVRTDFARDVASRSVFWMGVLDQELSDVGGFEVAHDDDPWESPVKLGSPSDLELELGVQFLEGARRLDSTVIPPEDV